MVNFSIFNELSLPLRDIREFESFFQLLTELKVFGLEKIRMDKEFHLYPQILPDKSFQQLIGEISRDKKRRLLRFIQNGITVIESPLIQEDEKEYEQLLENEYFYQNKSTIGGLACTDIWNSIAISFNSHEDWNGHSIFLQKQTLVDDKEIDISIRHSSDIEHLKEHKDFFQELEKEKKLGITKDNFWDKKDEFFPNNIVFCDEVEKQINNLDKSIFQQAINILRDIETDKKSIRDYNYSGESKSVKQDNELKKYRYFTVDGEKVFFENHIKSLPNANRIYFLEQDNKIYIGYIGKHLPTKKY